MLTKAKLDPFISQPLSAYLAAAKKCLAKLKLVNLNDSLFCPGFLISHPLDAPLPTLKCRVLFVSSDVLCVCRHLHAAELAMVYQTDITGLLIWLGGGSRLQVAGVQPLGGGGTQGLVCGPK